MQKLSCANWRVLVYCFHENYRSLHIINILLLIIPQGRPVLFLFATLLPIKGYYFCSTRWAIFSILPLKMQQELQDEA